MLQEIELLKRQKDYLLATLEVIVLTCRAGGDSIDIVLKVEKDASAAISTVKP